MALSTNQAVGSTAATLQKAKLKRQQGGMSQASDKPLGKPVVRRVPNSIDQASPAPPAMARGMRSMPGSAPASSPTQGTAPGALGGGPPPQGPPGGNRDLMSLLPPKMQAAMAQNGRDPREAIATRMQNDPIFKQKMIAMQQQGGFPGGPSSGPIISSPMQPPPGGPRIDAGGDQVQGGPPSLGSGPDAAVSGMPAPGTGGAMQAPPPGADIGQMGLIGQPQGPEIRGATGPPIPGGAPQLGPGMVRSGGPGDGGVQGGFGGMNPQQLRQMLPPAMQQGFPGGFAGNLYGLNPQSLQLAQQGGGPAPGGQPQLGGVNPYRGM